MVRIASKTNGSTCLATVRVIPAVRMREGLGEVMMAICPGFTFVPCPRLMSDRERIVTSRLKPRSGLQPALRYRSSLMTVSRARAFRGERWSRAAQICIPKGLTISEKNYIEMRINSPFDAIAGGMLTSLGTRGSSQDAINNTGLCRATS